MNFFVLGLCALVGITLGLLGGGGAVLTVPVFVYLAGFTAHEAIPLSLLVISVSSFIGCLQHLKKHFIHGWLFLVFSFFGSIGAMLGSRIGVLISEALLLILFGLLMIAVGLILILKKQEVREETISCKLRLLPSILVGLVLGILTGLLGVGGGFMVVPSLALIMKCSMRTAIGTSLAVIAVNSAVGFAGHFQNFQVPLTIAASYTGASAFGVVIGSRLMPRIPPLLLRQSFGGLILALGLFLIIKNSSLL